MRIYLVGFMGSGKTNIGKLLSAKLNMAFYDLDQQFEEKYHYTVNHFFEQFGEPEFRKIERSLLLGTENLENTIVSTGGGTPCYFDNMAFINRNGLSIYFKLSVPQIISRLQQSKKPRPLVKGLSGNDLTEKVSTLLESRIPFYQQAHLTIEGFGHTLESLVEEIRSNQLFSVKE